MKTTNVIINFYYLDELVNEAKEKAIQDHLNFLLSEEDNVTERDAKWSIEANSYLFYKDGTLAHTVTYTDGERKGKTYFIDKEDSLYLLR